MGIALVLHFKGSLYVAEHRKSAAAKQEVLTMTPNPALNLVRFALWTLRDKAAQRR
ncbi:MAG: hypothetical protein Q8K23_12420 [Sulfuritalea sp.]|nr:hypothetical protein [Sulfuritalea sp.]